MASKTGIKGIHDQGVTPAIRLLLVDEHPIGRAGLRLLLESRPGLRVVGEAGTVAEAVALAGREQPDVILLGLGCGGVQRLQAIPALRAAAERARVLVLAGFRDERLCREAVRGGAAGVVLTRQPPEALFMAIEKVRAGEIWIERALMATMVGELLRPGPASEGRSEAGSAAAVTDRERSVIELLGRGLKNKQIAARLCLSEVTVRHHLTGIYSKLGVPDRVGLLTYAYRYGLVTPCEGACEACGEQERDMCPVKGGTFRP